MHTHAQVLDRLDISPPDAALADIEVPVIVVPQRQGDIAIVPFEFIDPDCGERIVVRGPLSSAERAGLTPVPVEGVAVVHGEATGNTHILMADHGCEVLWARSDSFGGGVSLGVVEVPEGATAFLVHTDEHGVNAMGPGAYVLHGKREQADEIRRVAD